MKIYIFFFSVLLVTISFFLQGHISFNMFDEGALWYESLRILKGDVPLLDYNSYDPGRYYLSAFFMKIFEDHGIITLRIILSLIQVFGLFIGGVLIERSIKEKKKITLFYIFLSLVILIFWQYPRHKFFDISILIFQIGILFQLIYKPTLKRHFVAGLLLGLVAFFGRNHGAYGFIAQILAIASIQFSRKIITPKFLKAIFMWVMGIIFGYFPMYLLMIIYPDFLGAFINSIKFMFTNEYGIHFSLPIPFPWTTDFSQGITLNSIRSFLVGCCFLALLIYPLAGLFWVIKILFKECKKNKLSQKCLSILLATFFLSIPYANYAYQRADVGHLCHAIFPMLIGIIIVILNFENKIVKNVVVCGIILFSVFIMYSYLYKYECLGEQVCKEVQVGKDTLLMNQYVARDINFVKDITKKYAPNIEDGVLIVPYWVLYPVIGKDIPTFEVRNLHPRTEDFQKEEIKRIEKANVKVAIVVDTPLDGNPKLKYSETHDLIYKYIVNNFEHKTDESQYLWIRK